MKTHYYNSDKTKNWYYNAQKAALTTAQKMIKLATRDFSANDDYSAARNQQASSQTLYDVQRYVMDSYAVKTALSETKDNITISLICNHNFLGTISWDSYWAYDKNEIKTAKKDYLTIVKGVQSIMEEFIDNRTPTPNFWPTVRARVCDAVASGNRVKANNPTVNYSRNIKYEEDWSKLIYGNRYPPYKEESYDQYTNNSRGRSGKFPD